MKIWKLEFQSNVFDDVRSKFVSAHCIVTSNVLTVTDENHKRCIFSMKCSLVVKQMIDLMLPLHYFCFLFIINSLTTITLSIIYVILITLRQYSDFAIHTGKTRYFYWFFHVCSSVSRDNWTDLCKMACIFYANSMVITMVWVYLRLSSHFARAFHKLHYSWSYMKTHCLRI